MPPRTRNTAEPKPAADKATKQAPAETPEQPTEPTVDVAAFEARVAELEAELAARDEKPRNVIEAILAVMRDVRAVGKDGENKEQGFNFRGIDGTVNALGPAMRKHGLVVLPTLIDKEHEQVTTRNNRTMNSVHVTVCYTFYGPGGLDDKVEAVTSGESFDTGDKGTAKAMSVAFRTALLQGFALPTQERDPDEDSHELVTPPTTAEFQAEVNAAVEAAGDDADAIVAALIAIGDAHGEPLLNQVAIPRTETNRAMNGTDWLKGAIAHFQGLAAVRAAQRAEQERAAAEADLAAQTGAGQGAPTNGADGAEQTAPAPAQSAPVESDQHRAASEQTRSDVAATSAPADAFKDALVEEIAAHADIVGVPARAYVESLMATKQGASSVRELPTGLIRRWVIDQRPSIVGTLRQSGRATLAHALESLGSEVRPWTDVVAEADRLAGAEAPAHV